MEEGFVKGCSDNLPKVDSIMMALYFKSNPDFMAAELRGVKASRSSKESYGDNAVGYVKVKRDGSECVVKGKITPEHKVRGKGYDVIFRCDEEEEVIHEVHCLDCEAALGGCKHALAFLAWLHRRSEEPSVTDTVCYWKKSKLSAVGTGKKFIYVSELGTGENKYLKQNHSKGGSFLDEVLSHGISERKMLGSYFCTDETTNALSLHKLVIRFKEQYSMAEHTSTNFLSFLVGEMRPEYCTQAADATKKQHESELWHELRYGRITASKLHEAAHCSTLRGSLVELILGAKAFKGTKATKRGILLEKEVIKVVSRDRSLNVEKSGIILSSSLPEFGASPDGLTDDFVVEIKCPTSLKRMSTYVSEESIMPRYLAQIHLQMAMAEKYRCLFCVAHPDFEESKKVETIQVDYNKIYCDELLSKASIFWKKAIFPNLNSVVL